MPHAVLRGGPSCNNRSLYDVDQTLSALRFVDGRLVWGDQAAPVDLPRVTAGWAIRVGAGHSRVVPDLDFETYSEAGFIWNGEKWLAPLGAQKKGLPAVGVAVYATHPSTEILALAYDLKDGRGRRRWRPGQPDPVDLLQYVASGGEIEAHNVSFELWIWNCVGVRRYGWPVFRPQQALDSMAKARAYGLPGALGKLGPVLNLDTLKIEDGKRLLDKFSVPRKPTKNNPALRLRLDDEPEEAAKFYDYNEGDIITEAEASARLPDLPPEELAFFRATLETNLRGCAVDRAGMDACLSILSQALEKYNTELAELTAGTVQRASEVAKLTGWLGAYGVRMQSMDDEAVTATLARDNLPPAARRALEIRKLVGSASVKKVYALARQITEVGRVHDMFIYHAARTGRDAGADVQPQNLPKAGPALTWCEDATCGKPYGRHHTERCPFCHAPNWASRQTEWTAEATDTALEVMGSGSLEYVEYIYGDALLTISGCIRGLFVAGPGMDFICSDFSSIEAVVTAMLAGEQWRIDAFHAKKDIYYASASRITGVPEEEYAQHKAATGAHHSDRQKIGKPAELGLGFSGWLGAWRQFDKSDTFTDDEVKANIMAWREASPAIVELWGGQVRGKPWKPERHELYGLEGAAIAAVQNPGQCFSYRSISYGVVDDVLLCRLPSGRHIAYQSPRLSPSSRWPDQLELTFMAWNSNPKMGAMGWVRMQTYGGRLTENVVQAVARDIMRDAALRLDAAGYPIVLRVHDELAAEVLAGTGSIGEFERLMSIPPPWAAGWPIRASGGWRGRRFRKE